LIKSVVFIKKCGTIVNVSNKNKANQMTRAARRKFNAFDTADFATSEAIFIGHEYVGTITFVPGSWSVSPRKYIKAHWSADDDTRFPQQQQAADYQRAIGRDQLLASGLGF
jgi:hypothetical protein